MNNLQSLKHLKMASYNTDNSVSIDIESKRYNFTGTLSHKLNIIVGDSGVGKSILVDLLIKKPPGVMIRLSNDYNVVQLFNNGWQRAIEINSPYKTLFVIDDLDLVFSSEFISLFKKSGNCLFMLIVRTIPIDKIKRWNNISIHGDAIFNQVADGKIHYLVEYNAKNNKMVNGVDIDVVICEDRKSGFQFFSNIHYNVLSSDGKDNIVDFIINNAGILFNKSILLVVDYAAIGYRLKPIFDILDMIGCKAYISYDYESFEYMLLRSNFFGIKRCEILNSEFQYDSLERCCTDLLTNLSAGKHYSYNKGNLSKCYYKDCCSMDRKHFPCDRGMSGDKIKLLLENTEFEYILSLRRDK